MVAALSTPMLIVTSPLAGCAFFEAAFGCTIVGIAGEKE
jgi:hypothetical protein